MFISWTYFSVLMGGNKNDKNLEKEHKTRICLRQQTQDTLLPLRRKTDWLTVNRIRLNRQIKRPLILNLISSQSVCKHTCTYRVETPSRWWWGHFCRYLRLLHDGHVCKHGLGLISGGLMRDVQITLELGKLQKSTVPGLWGGKRHRFRYSVSTRTEFVRKCVKTPKNQTKNPKQSLWNYFFFILWSFCQLYIVLLNCSLRRL